VVASDKLFYWLFQQHAERLQPLVAGLLPRIEGYVFSSPVLKEREYRLDGLFLPPADQPELPALILEAQMAADPGFLLRLNAETARLLQHQDRQGRPISQWQVVVICPSRELNFGDLTPVREFVRERLVWIELAPERLPPTAPPLQKALSLLLLPEDQLPACSKAIRAEAAGTGLAAEIDDVIAAILVRRFSGRTVPEPCARGCKPVWRLRGRPGGPSACAWNLPRQPATWRSYSQPLASRHPQGLLLSDQPAHSRRAPACPLRAHPCRSAPVQPTLQRSTPARPQPSAAGCFAEDVAPGRSASPAAHPW